MRIAEASKAADVTPRMIRYAEKNGLLPAPARRDSGYREYGDADVARLRVLGLAQSVGFSLAEAADLLRALDAPGEAMDAERVAAAWAERLDVKASALDRLRDAISARRPGRPPRRQAISIDDQG